MASAELFEDPFDPDEYVERLAWRTPGGGTKGGAQGFNPEVSFKLNYSSMFFSKISYIYCINLTLLDFKLHLKVLVLLFCFSYNL